MQPPKTQTLHKSSALSTLPALSVTPTYTHAAHAQTISCRRPVLAQPHARRQKTLANRPHSNSSTPHTQAATVWGPPAQPARACHMTVDPAMHLYSQQTAHTPHTTAAAPQLSAPHQRGSGACGSPLFSKCLRNFCCLLDSALVYSCTHSISSRSFP